MFKFLNITCEQAHQICNKAQYNEASLKDKIKLNWHILLCKTCALYSKQNTLLSKMFRFKAKDCKQQSFCMSDSEKQSLKKEFEKQSLT